MGLKGSPLKKRVNVARSTEDISIGLAAKLFLKLYDIHLT